MKRIYYTIEEAIEKGFTHVSDEDGKTRKLSVMLKDDIEVLYFPYIVEDDQISDDLMLKIKEPLE